MRDPHVAALRYKLVPGETVSFDCPPAVERETAAFRVRLEDGVVTFEMIEHHASEGTARRCVDEYLRAWEIHTALRFGRGEVRFEFEGADVIDRDPRPPRSGAVRGGGVLYAKAALAAAGALAARFHVTRREYPDPPDRFVVSADVETMWHRYEGYLEGREPLAPMAYFCLTVLVASAGGRKKAAEKYAISRAVLSNLARVATEVGDERTARKFDHLKEQRPHTGAEKAWIEAAVKALIRRAGERASNPRASLPEFTMSDLPEL